MNFDFEFSTAEIYFIPIKIYLTKIASFTVKQIRNFQSYYVLFKKLRL
jgi:hypothetical protein